MANAEDNPPSSDSARALTSPSRAIRLDESEAGQLIAFLREAPGRISVVIVPGPVVTADLVRRIRQAGMEVGTLPLNAPLALADALAAWRERDIVATIAGLDASRHFSNPEAGAAFWRDLNLQREHLAPGNVRLCLFVDTSQHSLVAGHADDLRAWAREFSFLDAVVPVTVGRGLGLDRRDSEAVSPRRIAALRAQLGRARESGLVESVVVRDFALPLFEALVEHGRVREAERVWQQDLRQGAAVIGSERHWWVTVVHGDLLASRGQLADAEAEYRKALTLLEPQATRRPDTVGRQQGASTVQERIGDVRLAQGDLAGALRAYEESLAVRQRLAQADPSNAVWQRDLSVGQGTVGNVRLAQDDLAGALRAYDAALPGFHMRAMADPSNAGWQRDLSLSLTKLADVHEKLGHRAEALPLAEQSLAIDERLAALDPTNATWQKDVAASRALVARLRG